MLAQDTFRTDECGAQEAAKVLFKAVEDLMAISSDAKARLEQTDQEGLLFTYVISGFEGALRPV